MKDGYWIQDIIAALMGFFLASVLFYSCQSKADTTSYRFTFDKLNDEKYVCEVMANDRYEAMTKATIKCFNYYKQGRHLGRDEADDIIDTCVNPRGMK